jgi:hypothetical protein
MAPSRRTGAVALLALLGLATPWGSVADSPPDGRQIMQRVEDRDDGDDAIADLRMTLIDKRGNQRVREIRSFTKDFGEDEYQLLFFLSPADVKDTGFLTFDYDDPGRDEDQWLYLPALKKTKRIAVGDKSGSFMGSDFSYADMTSRELDHYDFRLMKEAEVGGVEVWQVEAIPRSQEEVDETGYTKSVYFVRKDIHFVIRAVHWVEKGSRLKYLDVKRLDQIDGIWVGTEIHMTTKKNKAILHRTILEQQNVQFGQDLDADLFSVRQLEKGL